jgi:transposase-like protein
MIKKPKQLSPEELEIKRLKKEIKEVKMEVDILKEADKFFQEKK